MEILEKVEIMETEPLFGIVLLLLVLTMGILLVLVISQTMSRGRVEKKVWILAAATLIASIGLIISNGQGFFDAPTGRYTYTATITDQAALSELYQKYDNIELINENVVTFEDKE